MCAFFQLQRGRDQAQPPPPPKYAPELYIESLIWPQIGCCTLQSRVQSRVARCILSVQNIIVRSQRLTLKKIKNLHRTSEQQV